MAQVVVAETAVGRKPFKGVAAKVLLALTALYALYLLLYVSGVLTLLNITIYGVSHRAAALGIGLALTFIYFPATKGSPKDRVPWYDVAAIILGLVVNFYIVFNSVAIIRAEHSATPMQQAFGLIAVALVLESARRTIAPVLALIGLAFFVYPFVVPYLPAIFHGPKYSLSAVVSAIYLFPSGIYGSVMHLFATVLAAFLVFGAFIAMSGAGDFFIRIAMALAGRFRGGPAKVAMLASGAFGMINGSTVANAAAMGVITIPLMKRVGYRPEFAAAVEAVASSGGPIMPPMLGVVVFIMMDILGISYLTIMLAAALPALLYYYAAFLMVDLEAAKTGLVGLPRHELPSIRQTIKQGWLYVVPILALVLLIAVPRYSPQTAAIYSLVVLLLLGLLKKEMRMGPKRIISGLSEGSLSLLRVASAMAVAGLLLGSISLTGLGYVLAGKLVTIAGGNLIILLVMTGFTCYIMGTAVSTIGVYLLVATLVAPALILVGLPPLVAHFFVWYMAESAMITPPVCMAVYVTASIAGCGFMRSGLEAVRLGIVIFLVPLAIALSPALLLIGSPTEIVLAAISGLAAVTFLSFGLQGFFLRKLNWPSRILLWVGGLALFAPLSAWTIKAIGLVFALLPLIWQLGATRLVKTKTVA